MCITVGLGQLQILYSPKIDKCTAPKIEGQVHLRNSARYRLRKINIKTIKDEQK